MGYATRFELLLPLGALAFYVYDCGILLYDNELLLLNAGRRWSVEPGGEQLLFQRRVCFPGLMQPWRAIYRFVWRDSPAPALAGVTAAGPADAEPPLPGLLPLQLLCSLMLVLLLPVLPLVSLSYGAGWALLGVFVLYYLLIVVALALIWRHRRDWQLGGRAYLSMVLDSLACAPFATNLLRRVSLQQRFRADGVDYARAVCAGPVRRRLHSTLTARLDERIAGMGADSVSAQPLRERRQQLEGLLE